jgi:hypothetical protein
LEAFSTSFLTNMAGRWPDRSAEQTRGERGRCPDAAGRHPTDVRDGSKLAEISDFSLHWRRRKHRPDARLPTSSVLLRSGIGDGEGGRPGTNETDDAGKARGWRDGVASGVLACWGGGSGEGEGGRSWRQRAVED